MCLPKQPSLSILRDVYITIFRVLTQPCDLVFSVTVKPPIIILIKCILIFRLIKQRTQWYPVLCKLLQFLRSLFCCFYNIGFHNKRNGDLLFYNSRKLYLTRRTVQSCHLSDLYDFVYDRTVNSVSLSKCSFGGTTPSSFVSPPPSPYQSLESLKIPE